MVAHALALSWSDLHEWRSLICRGHSWPVGGAVSPAGTCQTMSRHLRRTWQYSHGETMGHCTSAGAAHAQCALHSAGAISEQACRLEANV
jgi:hypothetical protein